MEPVHVAKGSPQQNGHVERFNGAMRDELLNREQFHSLTEAQIVIAQWVEHYNTARPRGGLNMQTPAGYAALKPTQAPTTLGASSERGDLRATATTEAGPDTTRSPAQIQDEFSHIIWTNFSGPDSGNTTPYAYPQDPITVYDLSGQWGWHSV